MNDFDDLDDLFGQLRSAATEAELAGETSHLDAMARHHRRQKGHNMFTTRRARVATFVAAGVIGFGGVAAAGSGGPFFLTGSDDTTTTSTSEVTTTTSEVTTTTSEAPTTTSEVTTTTSEVVLEDDAPVTQSVIEETVDPDADDAPLVDDPATDFDETTCLDGNHGKTVSAVARNEPPFENVEQRVAAQSSCGKDAEDDADDDADDPVEVDDEVETDDDASDENEVDDDSDDDRPEQGDKPGRPESPGKSGERGNGSKKNSGD
jgi:hypothetical protein